MKKKNKSFPTVKQLREAIEAMRLKQVRPDMKGNFRIIPGYGFIDERDYWLGGYKPVG